MACQRVMVSSFDLPSRKGRRCKARPSQLRRLKHSAGLRVRLAADAPLSSADYVPSCHEERYRFWFGVSLSICEPHDASLSRAISLSMSVGTG